MANSIENNGIVYIRDYGKVNFKLKEYMDERGINRNALSKLVNTRFGVIDKWYRNDVEKIDADVLARICFVLDCKIENILEYEKNPTDK